MRKFLSTFLLIFALTAFAKSYTVDEVPNVQLTDSTKLVSNPDGIISSAAETQINQMLLNIRRQTSCQVAMVLIDDMAGDTDIDNFATDLFTKWGIGKKDKDNGVLIVVAKDAHKYVIRTGYGTEGVLPDVVCGRIGRRILAPAFKENDFDGGLINATKTISDLLTDPDVRDELMSQLGDDNDDDFSFADFMYAYLAFSVIMTLLLALFMVGTYTDCRRKDRHEKYRRMRKFEGISALASFLCLGIPVLIYFPIKHILNQWRNGEHKCRNCSTVMQKLDEETDNNYLTPSQDREEQLNSVDYDVWLCPNCGETDVYAYVNPESTYKVCSHCKARATRLIRDSIIMQPTTYREGYGERIYQCLNCGKETKQTYKIPKSSTPVVIIPGGGGFRSSGGGSGFGGGSFGGGMTGGGGASGGW